MKKSGGFLLCLIWASAAELCAAPAAPMIVERSGVVEFKAAKDKFWRLLPRERKALEAGESVRTGAGAALVLAFKDASRVELGENTVAALKSAEEDAPELALAEGGLRVLAKKRPVRTLVVRTGAGSLKTRGGQFSVRTVGWARAVLEVESGAVSVRDLREREALVFADERLEIDRHGMRQVEGRPTRGQVALERWRAQVKRERALTAALDAVRGRSVVEVKRPEFEQGNILTDVFGSRVRHESYVIRPADNQVKVVTLNSRSSGFSYSYTLATFNRALPDDLASALRQVPGAVDAAPLYFLTGLTQASSNLHDSVLEIAQGGHSVDVNHNNDALDNVAALFDPGRNGFVDVAGRNLYRTLFDRYGLYVNGALKHGWTGADIQSYANDAALSTSADPITGAALAQNLPIQTVTTTFPDLAHAHTVVYRSYGDGTYLRSDAFASDAQGRAPALSEFGGPVFGASYQSVQLRYNYERVITAGAFQGRSIDLMIDPKIVLQFGVLP